MVLVSTVAVYGAFPCSRGPEARRVWLPRHPLDALVTKRCARFCAFSTHEVVTAGSLVGG